MEVMEGSGLSPVIPIAHRGNAGISEFRERRGWGGSGRGAWGWCQDMLGFLMTLPTLKLPQSFWLMWNSFD